MEPVVRAAAVAEVAGQLVGFDVRLGQQHRVPAPPLVVLAQVGEELEVLSPMLPSGLVFSMMNGTASIRNPATPSCSQNDAIFLISSRTLGLLVFRSGWNCRTGGSTSARGPVVGPGLVLLAREDHSLAPVGRFCSDQTYQSRYGESAEERADWNHGCWSEVWLTTRSMMTRIPRFSAACRTSAKSPSVPSRGGRCNSR